MFAGQEANKGLVSAAAGIPADLRPQTSACLSPRPDLRLP